MIRSHQNREGEGEDITKLLKENNTTDLGDIKKTMLESGNALYSGNTNPALGENFKSLGKHPKADRI